MSLLKNALGVPLGVLRQLHTGSWLGHTVTRRHHDQRLSYGRVSLGSTVGCRNWWSYGECMVVDLTWLFQGRRMARMTRSIRSLVTHRAWLWRYLWTSEWECRLQLKWLRTIGRKCLTQAVDLLLHFWHRERRRYGFQDAHVAYKEAPGVMVDIWVRTCHSNLWLLIRCLDTQ